jgi:hypothetical protein
MRRSFGKVLSMAFQLEPGDEITFVDVVGQPDALEAIVDQRFADQPITVTIDDGHVKIGPTTYWSKAVGVDPDTGATIYKMLPMERS